MIARNVYTGAVDLKKVRHANSAAVVQPLVMFDGPQLLYLRSNRQLPMLAVATLSDRPSNYPMFAAELFDHEFNRYMMGKVDLNFVFRRTPKSRLYFFDLSDCVDSAVTLRRATASDISNNENYPEPGLFSRIHTDSLEEPDGVRVPKRR